MLSGHARAVAERLALGAALCAFLLSSRSFAVVDRDNNQQSDIWQLLYGTGNLAANADTDGDGVTNLAESAAGTNPLDPRSRLTFDVSPAGSGLMQVRWPSLADKRYQISHAPTLGAGVTWTTAGSYNGTSADLAINFGTSGEPGRFFRLTVDDVDTDGDGAFDWEERRVGFDPNRRNTEGLGSSTTLDLQLLTTALAATNTVTVAAADSEMAETWPDPGIVVIRRAGNLNAITVNYTVGGSASAGADYQGPTSGSVDFALGVNEVWLNFQPLADGTAESTETITVTVTAGSGYNVGAAAYTTATVNLTDGGQLSYEEAARFLSQATFGATDAEIARVQQLGYAGWLDEQFARAPQYHLPLVQQWHDEMVAIDPAAAVSSTERTEVWWRRALQSDGARDPLRQRVAHALSQIFVISDRQDSLSNTPRGMAAFHDEMLEHAFGSYRELLKSVTLHPTMGYYLSHYRNRKAVPAQNIYPDENYAREIMQLFSIGLWELNPDGTRQLDGDGDPIPTYDNDDIANFARVFTGLSHSKKYVSSSNLTIVNTTGFFDGNGLAWEPMRGFDAYHDVAAKTLLNGQTIPARTASSPDTGAATLADIDVAMDNLSNHPNTGPFIGRLLIQRLTTSNPSPGYVGRVAAAFANNGSGVRGDLRAVVRAILLDVEARDPSLVSDVYHGMQREPYLRYVALVRAMNVTTPDGRFRGFRNIDAEFQQRPYSSPSVFNFYSPDFQPLGPVKDAGMVGPEFQITNSVTGITSPNRFYSGITGNLNPSGQTDTTQNSRIDTAPWIDDATNNADVLIARLDRLLTGGTLSQQSLRNISRAVRRLTDPLTQSDPTARTNAAIARFRMALYLVCISPEACIQQ
jgi:uncharacterized protein (DUF1800 family)